MGIKTLDGQARAILRDYSYTRNDDIDLWVKIIEFFYSDYVNNGSVELKKLHDLPREDHVKRVRAKIQNDEGLYLPTDPAVAEKRGWAQDAWGNYVRREQVHQTHEKPSTPVVKQSEVHPEEEGQTTLLDVPTVQPNRINDGRRD